ncbi:uncharacterized protein TNCV_4766921 [Trichonephila clavipes]|nr:uncharacterized protein TNCV_4766921 [Trichonephila clavipes]
MRTLRRTLFKYQLKRATHYPPECNQLIILGLETPLRFFGSSPNGCTRVHYSAIADDKHVTLTALVKMWKPQQMMQCVLWLTENKSVTRLQRRVRAEWNVATILPNRRIRTPTK